MWNILNVFLIKGYVDIQRFTKKLHIELSYVDLEVCMSFNFPPSWSKERISFFLCLSLVIVWKYLVLLSPRIMSFVFARWKKIISSSRSSLDRSSLARARCSHSSSDRSLPSAVTSKSFIVVRSSFLCCLYVPLACRDHPRRKLRRAPSLRFQHCT